MSALSLKLEHGQAGKAHAVPAIVVVNVTTSRTFRIPPHFSSGARKPPACTMLDNEFEH
jgi:hypothetical protein